MPFPFGSVETREFARRNAVKEETSSVTLGSLVLSISPVVALTLGKTQPLTGSSSQSSGRQARLMVLTSGYRGGVRVVVGTTPTITLARDREDGTIEFMEAATPFAASAVYGGEAMVPKLIEMTLIKRLVGPDGGIASDADIRGAFMAAMIRVEAWMNLKDVLTDDELAAAEQNRKASIRPWTCRKSSK